MKKLLSVLIASALLIPVFTACSDDDSKCAADDTECTNKCMENDCAKDDTQNACADKCIDGGWSALCKANDITDDDCKEAGALPINK